jgi:hypothetical protein
MPRVLPNPSCFPLRGQQARQATQPAPEAGRDAKAQPVDGPPEGAALRGAARVAAPEGARAPAGRPPTPSVALARAVRALEAASSVDDFASAFDLAQSLPGPRTPTQERYLASLLRKCCEASNHHEGLGVPRSEFLALAVRHQHSMPSQAAIHLAHAALFRAQSLIATQDLAAVAQSAPLLRIAADAAARAQDRALQLTIARNAILGVEAFAGQGVFDHAELHALCDLAGYGSLRDLEVADEANDFLVAALGRMLGEAPPPAGTHQEQAALGLLRVHVGLKGPGFAQAYVAAAARESASEDPLPATAIARARFALAFAARHPTAAPTIADGLIRWVTAEAARPGAHDRVATLRALFNAALDCTGFFLAGASPHAAAFGYEVACVQAGLGEVLRHPAIAREAGRAAHCTHAALELLGSLASPLPGARGHEQAGRWEHLVQTLWTAADLHQRKDTTAARILLAAVGDASEAAMVLFGRQAPAPALGPDAMNKLAVLSHVFDRPGRFVSQFGDWLRWKRLLLADPQAVLASAPVAHRAEIDEAAHAIDATSVLDPDAARITAEYMARTSMVAILLACLEARPPVRMHFRG